MNDLINEFDRIIDNTIYLAQNTNSSDPTDEELRLQLTEHMDKFRAKLSSLLDELDFYRHIHREERRAG